jgi:hypothetical protein
MLYKKRFLFTALLSLQLLCVADYLTAATLTGTFSSVASSSNVDLTIGGKLDWIHWGLYTDTSMNRKAGVTPSISNFVLVGDTNSYITEYQYADNANGYTWYDGSPVPTVTNSTTGVWAYGTPISLGSGFQLTLPADTTQRTLQVFVGAFNAKGQFTASLSDGSAPAFTNGINETVNNLGNGPGGVFSIAYAANSPGQTLTIKWTLALVRGLNANVTLQAATLTAAGVDNPPYVILTGPINNSSFTEPANITFNANAQDFDGTVTNVAFYSGTNKLAQTSVSPYSYTWMNVPRGAYALRAAATDNSGVTSFSQPINVFIYGSGGSQNNAVEASATAIDLTAEGSADWTHWGLFTNTSFDYKAFVQRKISNFSALGTNAIQRYADNYTSFSWSDGTPTVATNGTTTGLFVTGVTNGFRLTAPADLSPRTLRVYVGGYGVQAEFQAYLTDFSAQPYTDTSVSNFYGNSYVVYTIYYSAASTNQHLIVIYRSSNLFDFAYGNVTLQAASLQGGVSEPLPVRIINPMRVGGDFLFSFETQSNYNYAVQSGDSLSVATWASETNVVGTGSIVTVTNHTSGATQRFYRVQTQ